jgi:UDP-hydrolysing UDP-N-acetyl-D-glucosamine 2-epimerase
MLNERAVAVATFGRSDFSILRPLVARLVETSGFNAGLWVGGAHFDEVSGCTVRDIEASGLPIWARIDDSADYGDRSPYSTVEVMAAQLTGFARAAAQARPDLLLILGDRFEAVSAGLAMVPLGVPVGHISGGSITEGAIDDVFRHCLTKIAALHFCELPRFARRIHHMGEDPATIFTTGALGLDALVAAQPHSFDEFAAHFGFDGLRPGYVLATLHSETRQVDLTADMAAATVSAIARSGRQVVYTYPNADPGSDAVIAQIEAATQEPDAFCVRSFGAAWYPTAMAHAAMMVGNSSGGIIEAATFNLPVVDIGERQTGREHGANVIRCGRDEASIAAGIERAGSADFRLAARGGNIYGDGHGAERVAAALTTLDWERLGRSKRFVDPDPSFRGDLMELSCT